MKWHLSEAAQIQGVFSSGLHRHASSYGWETLSTVHRKSQINKRQVLVFFPSMSCDVIIVETMHNLKNEDYSFKLLEWQTYLMEFKHSIPPEEAV